MLAAKGRITLEPSFDDHRKTLQRVANDIVQFGGSLQSLADDVRVLTLIFALLLLLLSFEYHCETECGSRKRHTTSIVSSDLVGP